MIIGEHNDKIDTWSSYNNCKENFKLIYTPKCRSRYLNYDFQNVRRLNTKVDEFFTSVVSNDADRETWLCDDVQCEKLLPDFYIVYRDHRRIEDCSVTRVLSLYLLSYPICITAIRQLCCSYIFVNYNQSY